MEMVENYFLGNETVSDSAHGHICPIVFLVAKGYMVKAGFLFPI